MPELGPAAAGPGHRLTLLPAGWQLPVPAGKSLLHVAIAAGIQLPSSCRNGTCRACLARLVSGDIDGNGTADFAIRIDGGPALSAEHFIL